jgi:hypothetical protein
MGGLACWARFSSTLTFKEVPTDSAQIPIFDQQMKEYMKLSGTPESLAVDVPGALQRFCALWDKAALTHDDRVWMLKTYKSLWVNTPAYEN